MTRIGVIADDVTGATDVAAALSRAGLRTLLSLTAGVDADATDADAIVIGLKTRSIAVADAVAQSLDALRALQQAGADSFYLKYCSTFDSTAEGNIGPVVEALAAALGTDVVVTTPAAPLHGRTLYQGHLFVDGRLLHETHMRTHPVTPMRDSSVPRLLAPQVRGAVRVLPLETVHRGVDAVRKAIAEAGPEAGTGAEAVTHLVADAVDEADLAILAEAVEGSSLVAGSAGLIGAIAQRREPQDGRIPSTPAGRTAILAGSCSARTLEQVERFRESGGAAHRLVATPGDSAEGLAAAALAWWARQPADASAMIYSSSPEEERDPRVPDAGALYERVAGLIAHELVDRGVARLLIAGGETSGAVVEALGLRTALVGEEAARGAPWIHDPARDLHLVLKSGNFGEPDLFVDVVRSGATR